MTRIIAAAEIFTGTEILSNKAIVIEEGIISEIISYDGARGATFYEGVICPGFIDLQVYGAGGCLFSQYPTAETLFLMESIFKAEGCFRFQPTMATNTYAAIRSCIDAVRDYRRQGGSAVIGLHVEGPWINAEKRGAHVAEWVREPRLEEVRDILDYGEGVITMITMAPENCPPEVSKMIRERGIILSAGHSNCSYDGAMKSFDQGFTAVTHLFNAMSPLHHRDPGLPGAVMQHSTVAASIIPDGYHVDFAAIAIAKKILGERLFAITDAVTATDEGPYRHYLSGDRYECNGTLSGSAISMHRAFINLVNNAGTEKWEAHRMCSLYPSRVAGMEIKIAPGSPGQFLVLDKQLELACVIDGERGNMFS